MADPSLKLKIFQMVEKMSLEESRQLVDSVNTVQTKQQAGQHEKVRAWFEKNYLLMQAIQAQFQQGNTLGLSERDMSDFMEQRGVFQSISGGYNYAVVDWQNQDPQGALAQQYLDDALKAPGYQLFRALSKSLQDQAREIETGVANKEQRARDIDARAQQKAQAEQAQEKAQKKAARLEQQAQGTLADFKRRMEERGDATEKEVVCILILANGNYYEGIHTEDLGELHPVARLIAGGDQIAGQSIKSCAEFKALNKYLHAVLPNATRRSEVPAGGRTTAYTYLKRSGGLQLATKAPCQNCDNWLASLSWTAAPGDY
jgi:hypothetical protein